VDGPADGQTDNLMDLHKSVRSQYTRYVNHVQRYLNGQYTNNTPDDVQHAAVPRPCSKRVSTDGPQRL
jgi:hypothetical protein